MTSFRSLGARIYGVAAGTAAIALLLGFLMLQRGNSSNDAFDWLTHTQEVIISLDGLESRLSQAESRQRGYLMSRDQTYLDGFREDLAAVAVLTVQLRELVVDNPAQELRAERLAKAADEKAQAMVFAIQRAREDPSGKVFDQKARVRGRSLMTAVTQQVGMMRREESRLLALRTAGANVQVAKAKALVLYGYPFLLLLIGGIAWLIRASITRPIADLLDVVTRFGAGDRHARAATTARSIEFERLAAAYNDMADQLVAVIDQQDVRQQSVQLLSETSHRLQAIQNEGELPAVLDCFLPKLLGELAGALYVHNHSRNMLLKISSWGTPQAAPEMFAPSNCWALRRGQAHSVEALGADLTCAHGAGRSPIEQRCEPVLAGGEVLGLLYIEGHVTDECHFRLGMLMENIALALVSDNLRSRLREQSIRDPLTKLFNRRYMEEALALETARAERSGTPLSIVMCDIDHFKRFNDGHGHEAGDLLLSGVANLVQKHFRGGDIVCRYGGEEFTVIAPGATRALISKRVEALRTAIGKLTIEFQGHRFGPVTMSFGIDSWSAGDHRPAGAMLSEADRALFEAKRLGRDRIAFSSGETEAAA